MKHLREAFDLLKATFNQWNEDKAPRLAAALAYYTAFSIAPLLVVVVAVVGLVFDQQTAQAEIMMRIEHEIGAETAAIIQTVLDNASQQSSGVIAGIVGLVTIVLGAAGFFGQLQDALNMVWEVAPKPGQGMFAVIRQRFLSFTMVLGIGFLLLVSLIISAVLASLNAFVTGLLPQALILTQILNTVISLAIITLLFALIYKVLPDVDISWKDVWVGAFMTALLFTIGKLLLGLYLGSSGVASSYGVAGSFVVLLLWIYYSAQILLFGAEFTQVHARRDGARIRPSENAVALTSEQRVQEGIPPEEDVVAKAVHPEPALLQTALAARAPEKAALPAHIEPAIQARHERTLTMFWVGLAVYNTLIAAFSVISAVAQRKVSAR